MAKGRKDMPAGPGRPKGLQNKATREAREAIAMFVEGNVDRLEGWLDGIAEEDPKAAFDRFMSVVEYHIPKLARVEQQQLDENGNPAAARGGLDVERDKAIIEMFAEKFMEKKSHELEK